jgi:hypothetical protein
MVVVVVVAGWHATLELAWMCSARATGLGVARRRAGIVQDGAGLMAARRLQASDRVSAAGSVDVQVVRDQAAHRIRNDGHEDVRL